MEYTAIIRKTEDGWYAAKCAQVPEAITQGRTLEEVKENLVDAIELVLQMKKERTVKEAKQENERYIYRKIAVV